MSRSTRIATGTLVLLCAVFLAYFRRDGDSGGHRGSVAAAHNPNLPNATRVTVQFPREAKTRFHAVAASKVSTADWALQNHVDAAIQDCGVSLTITQQEQLRRDIITIVGLYGALRRANATLDPASGRTLMVDVRPFPDAGNALRKQFLQRLATDFGPLTGDLQDHLGTFLDFEFAGWGIMAETYTVKPPDKDGLYLGEVFQQTVDGLSPSRIPGDHWMSSTKQLLVLQPNDLGSAEYSFLKPFFGQAFPSAR